MALSRVYGGEKRESPRQAIHIYSIQYVLRQIQSGIKRARQPFRNGHGCRFLCSQMLSGDFPRFWIRFFCARFQIFPHHHHLPPSFHCHLPLRENRRAPVDFTLNPRSRAQSAEDRTAPHVSADSSKLK